MTGPLSADGASASVRDQLAARLAAMEHTASGASGRDRTADDRRPVRPTGGDATATPDHTTGAVDGKATTAVRPTADPRNGDPGNATDEAVGRALAFVLRSTKARPQTAAELRDKLSAREYDADVIETAVDRATRLGAIDDAAFAHAWVADRGMVRGYSAARLRHELQRRQVPDPLIDQALRALDDRDDHAVATELARTRAQKLPATLPPETVARRLVGFLVRRGYPQALARRVAIQVSGLDRHWD